MTLSDAETAEELVGFAGVRRYPTPLMTVLAVLAHPLIARSVKIKITRIESPCAKMY